MDGPQVLLPQNNAMSINDLEQAEMEREQYDAFHQSNQNHPIMSQQMVEEDEPYERAPKRRAKGPDTMTRGSQRPYG